MGLIVSGCSNGRDSGHLSSQRAFLQKLVIEPELISEKAELHEEWIVAHNGCGKADVGGLLKNIDTNIIQPVITPPADAVEEVKSTEDAQAVPVESVQVEAVGSIEEQLNNARMTELINKVKPLGTLEGYAEVSYIIKNHVESDADEGLDPNVISLSYEMTAYPVFYLKNSEVTVGNPEAKDPSGGNPDVESEDPPEETVEEAVGNVEEEEKNKEVIVETFLPIAPVIAEDPETGVINIRIQAHGLLVLLEAAGKNKEIAVRCAEEVTRRIENEIATNQRAINEIRRQKGEVDGLSTYSPFWDYMGNHIDLEKKEYQPLLKEF
ncbi:MAG: hypothetical protein JXA52_07250 [Planctomycetes bacterium]|nr:hypothetical protein [Planctomycetota bacterium]